jgi:hypothetical protein
MHGHSLRSTIQADRPVRFVALYFNAGFFGRPSQRRRGEAKTLAQAADGLRRCINR